jgi:hypothetical protein
MTTTVMQSPVTPIDRGSWNFLASANQLIGAKATGIGMSFLSSGEKVGGFSMPIPLTETIIIAIL